MGVVLVPDGMVLLMGASGSLEEVWRLKKKNAEATGVMCRWEDRIRDAARAVTLLVGFIEPDW